MTRTSKEKFQHETGSECSETESEQITLTEGALHFSGMRVGKDITTD
jgi:hypothetical protein